MFLCATRATSATNNILDGTEAERYCPCGAEVNQGTVPRLTRRLSEFFDAFYRSRAKASIGGTVPLIDRYAICPPPAKRNGITKITYIFFAAAKCFGTIDR